MAKAVIVGETKNRTLQKSWQKYDRKSLFPFEKVWRGTHKVAQLHAALFLD